MSKSQTVEKIVKSEDGELFKTSAGDITEEELINRIRQGESFVVAAGKGEDGKDKVRALTVTTLGQLIYNDNKDPVRNTMEVEVAKKEEAKEAPKEEAPKAEVKGKK